MANYLQNLKVEYVPIGTITPYSGNAKLHPDEQVDEIVASIELVGFRDPIGVWNNEIVEGHGRYLAAKKLGMTEVPVIRLDDLTDEERRAYMLIHNKTTMDSGWDFDKLSEELDALADEIDMELFDFGLDDENDDPGLQTYSGEGAKEYDPEDFGDEKFKCECPRCGFKFNP